MTLARSSAVGVSALLSIMDSFSCCVVSLADRDDGKANVGVKPPNQALSLVVGALFERLLLWFLDG